MPKETIMIKFDEDSDLGQVIEKKELQSFGDKPIKSLKQLVYVAGGNKLSNLCKFKFISKSPTQYKEFCIAFVCKIRSKIYRQQQTNPSQWFIFKIISDKEIHCMTKKDLLAQYGFDIEKFFQSDYFAEGIKFFETSIENGLTKEIPAFVKEHGEEKAEDALTSYDGKNDAKIKDVVNRYAIAIKDSLRYLHDTRTNDKFYKLISYDGTVFEAERQELKTEADEKVSGYAIGTMRDGKLMFISLDPSTPYLSEFPYSVSDKKFEDDDLKVFERPMFGKLKDVKNYKVSYSKADADKFFKTGGKPNYTILDEKEAETAKEIEKQEQEKAEQEKFEAELDNAIEEALKEIYK